jgi:hypothetical protein
MEFIKNDQTLGKTNIASGSIGLSMPSGIVGGFFFMLGVGIRWKLLLGGFIVHWFTSFLSRTQSFAEGSSPHTKLI